MTDRPIRGTVRARVAAEQAADLRDAVTIWAQEADGDDVAQSYRASNAVDRLFREAVRISREMETARLEEEKDGREED